MLNERLSDARSASAHLARLSLDNGGPDVYWCIGYVVAMGCVPTPRPHEVWVDRFFPDVKAWTQDERADACAVLRRCGDLFVQKVDGQVHATYPDDANVEQWCDGYVSAVLDAGCSIDDEQNLQLKLALLVLGVIPERAPDSLRLELVGYWNRSVQGGDGRAESIPVVQDDAGQVDAALAIWRGSIRLLTSICHKVWSERRDGVPGPVAATLH